jgi:hypothetical protein
MNDEWLNNKELPTPRVEALLHDIEQDHLEQVVDWTDGDISRLQRLAERLERENLILRQKLARRN